MKRSVLATITESQCGLFHTERNFTQPFVLRYCVGVRPLLLFKYVLKII